MESKVSLLTPVYNGEKYLRSWAKYVVNQSYNNIQIIVINDGSTDNTSELLHNELKSQIEHRGYEYIVIDQPNQGAAGAVNNALKMVDGKYIMLFDCDDILMKDAIKIKAHFLDLNEEYAMVRNNGYYVKEKNLQQNSYLFVKNKKEKRNEYIFEDILYGRTNNWTSTYMIRTEKLWECLNGKDIYVSPWGQNMQFMLPVSFKYKTAFIDKPLMRYVDYGTGISRAKTYEHDVQMFNGYEENRIEIIKRISMPQKMLEQYITEVHKMYLHILLSTASVYRKKDDAEELYQQIKEQKDITVYDRLNILSCKVEVIQKVIKYINYTLRMMKCLYYKAEGKVKRHDKLY